VSITRNALKVSNLTNVPPTPTAETATKRRRASLATSEPHGNTMYSKPGSGMSAEALHVIIVSHKAHFRDRHYVAASLVRRRNDDGVQFMSVSITDQSFQLQLLVVEQFIHYTLSGGQLDFTTYDHCPKLAYLFFVILLVLDMAPWLLRN
jgi:hypothetical protein